MKKDHTRAFGLAVMLKLHVDAHKAKKGEIQAVYDIADEVVTYLHKLAEDQEKLTGSATEKQTRNQITIGAHINF